MKILMILLLILTSFQVQAGSIQLHTYSKHADRCDTCNEENWGIGYVGSNTLDINAGYYTNSWFRGSFYGGANLKLSEYFSTSLVLVSGYRGTSDTVDEYLIFGEFIPVPLFHYNVFPRQPVSPAFTYAPTRDGGVILFSLNMSIPEKEKDPLIVAIEDIGRWKER